MPRGDKSQHAKLFFLPWFAMDHGAEQQTSGCLLLKWNLSIPIWIPYLKSKRAAIWTQTPPSQSQGMVHSACCNDTDPYLSARSRWSICQIHKDASVAQKYEKRAFRTRVSLLTNTDCKVGSRTVYKSVLKPTKSFPHRGGIENSITYVVHKCTRTDMMNGLQQKLLYSTVSYREEQFSLNTHSVLQSIQTLGFLLLSAQFPTSRGTSEPCRGNSVTLR